MERQIEINLVSDSNNVKLYLVKEDGRILGFLEKHEDTPEETHPYKTYEAIVGHGIPRVNLGTMKPYYCGLSAAIDWLRYLYGSK